MFRESDLTHGRIMPRVALAIEDAHELDMLAISAGALRTVASRSPALSIVALLECMSDASTRRNLQHKGR